MAPSNPYFLEKNGINFSITTHGIKNLSEFRKNLIESHDRGASKAMLLKALTYNPSRFINMENKIGSLKESYIANFFIADGDIFSKETKILSNWIQGKWHRVTDTNINDYKGNYTLSFQGMDDKKINDLILNITGNKDKPAASITNIKESDSIKVKTNITVDDENITLTFKIPNESKGNTSGEYKLSGYF